MSYVSVINNILSYIYTTYTIVSYKQYNYYNYNLLCAGDLPYSELDNTIIPSKVMAGYRLDCPEGCPDQM